MLDDCSRHTIAWKLCTIMGAEDVTGAIYLALRASGFDQANAREDMDRVDLVLRSPAAARRVERRQVLRHTGGAWPA